VAPLDLNTQQVATDVKRQIGAAVLGDWPQHPYTQLHRSEHDRLLGDSSLVVRVHHERMFACASDGKG
jgi:hypothetical protein